MDGNCGGQPMFRFSIRDLLWLTLVVAVALGWWFNRRQLQHELQRAQAWRTRAGALKQLLATEGWKADWDFASSWVRLTRKSDGKTMGAGTDFAPSADPP